MKRGKILWMVIGLILGMVLMGGNGVMAGSGDPVETDKPVPQKNQLICSILSNGVYDGKSHSATVAPIADAAGMGAIMVKYFKDNSTTAMTTEPKDAGTYTVKVSIAEGDFFAATPADIELGSFTITPAPVKVTGITAKDKVYDGNTSATLDYTGVSLAGKVEKDDLSVTATGTFSDKNVEVNKTVTITGLTLGGNAAGNYTLESRAVVQSLLKAQDASGQQATTTASITPATVKVSGIWAGPKDYDGNTSATLVCTWAGFAGKVGNDDLSVTATGTFSDKNAGLGKTVTISDLKLVGNAAGNYTLDPSSQTTATTDIFQAGLSFSQRPTVRTSKVYDGTTTAAVTSQGSLANRDSGMASGMVPGDNVTSTATAAYDTPFVGTNKTITVTCVLSGKDAGNYSLAWASDTLTGEITAAPPPQSTSKVVSGISGAEISPLKEVSGGGYQSIITPSSGDLSKGLPAVVTVSAQTGGQTVALKEGTDFTYNALTGGVTILSGKANGTDTITVSGTCSDMTCDSTISGGSLKVSASPQYGIAYSGTVVAAVGQELPGAIAVTANGVMLGASGPIQSSVTGAAVQTASSGTDGDYTYDPATGVFTIAADRVHGPIVVTAVCPDVPVPACRVTYQVDGQNDGWSQGDKTDGATAGTTGRNQRLEAFKVKVTDTDGQAITGLGISYTAHVQNQGWMDEKSDGTAAGTTDQGLRLEAVTMKLTGDLADRYTVYYRVHVSGVGWMAWARDGAVAGTTGFGRAAEAIQAVVVKQGEAAPAENPASDTDKAGLVAEAITLEVHGQNYGWGQGGQTANQLTAATGGTTGQGLRLEAIRLTSGDENLKLTYQVHVQDKGWLDVADEGQLAGTTGQCRRMEALRIWASGTAASQYAVQYRVHVQNKGWTDWVEDGAEAGTTGLGLRIEAVQVRVVEKE